MIINIEQISFKKIRNLSCLFNSQESLTKIEDGGLTMGNKVNNTAYMFQKCGWLTNMPNFDTSNVTNMSGMFSECGDKGLNIPNFNTINVTDMSGMFFHCNLINIPNFDTINVKYMSSMFYECENLITVPNFNTSNVIDMNYMFTFDSNLTIVPNFNTNSTVNMEGMFDGCYNLTTIPNFDTSNVKYMSYMFYDCWKIQSIPTFNISNVIDMSWMFSGCQNLQNIAIFNSILNAQTNMTSMFADCTKLATINSNTIISLFNQAYNMQNIFTNCNNLTQSSINNIIYYLPNTNNLDNTQDYPLSYLGFSDKQIKLAISNLNACNRAIHNGWNIQTTTNYNVLYKTDVNATEWTAMPLNNVIMSNNAWAINNCFNANTPNKNTITNLKVNNLSGVTNLFNKFSNLSKLKNVEELNIPEVENTYSIFSGCGNLITISNINVINLLDASRMFNFCHKLTTVSNFNTSKVTSMSGMFGWDYNLIEVPNFNTSNVKYMSSMFYYCQSLTSIPNFNTSNVNYMGERFLYCQNLTTVPNFDTSNVTGMPSMFSYCFNLKTAPNFNTSKVTSMYRMFSNCNNLINMPIYNMNNVIDINSMFDNCKNLSLSSCENILYSIPYYNNITDINKYPMINYFAKNSALTNNNMIANLNSAAIAAAEEKGWFVTPTLKIDYTLLNGTTGTNKISINGMNGLEQLSNLRNMIQSSYTWNQAKKLIISGTSENLELAELGWGYIGPASLGSFFSSVSDLDFVGINTALATNGYEAFYQSNIINLNRLKTDSIINGAKMFSVCYFLNIQWNSWNFSNLQNAYSMFDYCNLTNLPGISSLMPNVTNMKSIFKNCSGITNNTMQNIVKMIPDYTQLVDDINPDNTLNYLGITNDQINMLSDDYKQMAADKHWNIPGFRAREKVSILPICNNLGAISNYSGTTNEYPMEVIYDDTYGDHFLQSKNQGKQSSNSSAVINFTNELVALCGNRYYMDIYYSCENHSDYLQIFKMNNGSSSWSQIGNYTGNSNMDYLHSLLDLENIQVGDQLRFTYYKDGSVDRGLDGCLISIYGYKGEKAYEITYSLVNEPEITKYKIIPKEEN